MTEKQQTVNQNKVDKNATTDTDVSKCFLLVSIA